MIDTRNEGLPGLATGTGGDWFRLLLQQPPQILEHAARLLREAKVAGLAAKTEAAARVPEPASGDAAWISGYQRGRDEARAASVPFHDAAVANDPVGAILSQLADLTAMVGGITKALQAPALPSHIGAGIGAHAAAPNDINAVSAKQAEGVSAELKPEASGKTWVQSSADFRRDKALAENYRQQQAVSTPLADRFRRVILATIYDMRGADAAHLANELAALAVEPEGPTGPGA